MEGPRIQGWEGLGKLESGLWNLEVSENWACRVSGSLGDIGKSGSERV